MELREAMKMAVELAEVHLQDSDVLGEMAAEVYTTFRAALAQPEQEPVAWLDDEGFSWVNDEFPDDYKAVCKPLYTTPPKREWQGLTDEEISKIYASTDWNDNEDWDYERAIEAKLKEKNT